MASLDDVSRVLGLDHGLCVVSTLRADATMQASLVNAGVLAHPITGASCVGFVARGNARKLANLRARPRATAVAHAGWEWVAVEGSAQLIGPDDPCDGIDAEGLRVLLRAVFSAAGGTHDDWDTFDSVMAAEGRAAVLIAPARVYSNG
jgi:PPOX class probable F420-dependent enzyme